MKIQELLDDIKNLDLILPEFQREYIWEKEQAKQLLVSLYKEYPTGSLLFWKTDNPPDIKNMAIPKDKIGSSKIILDGQQRLTTLYLFMKNEIPPYYKEYEIKNNPRNLYFNLEDGEFQYYQPTRMKDNPTWVSIVDSFDSNIKIDVFKKVQQLKSDPEEQFALANIMNENLTKLRNITQREYPIQLVPITANIDEAIDVFDRVNSMGSKLTDAELALAHICGKWPQARKVMKKKMVDLENHNFNFDLTFMVRSLTAVVKGRALYETIHQSLRPELEDGWNKLSRILDYIVNILPTHANIHSTEDLNSNNVLVPIVAYLSRNNMSFNNHDEMRKFIHWIYAAHTWSRYSSQTDQKLDSDISIILDEQNKHPYNELIDAIIDQRGRIEVKPSDLEGRSTQHPLFKMTYILAKARGAIDWFNGVPLQQPIGTSYSLHSHHIFPSSILYTSGGYSPENHLHKKVVNEIANRAFLTGSSNIQLSNNKPSEYLKEIANTYPGSLEKQFVPTDPNLWELDHYEDFLASRRELIAEAINEFMLDLVREQPEKSHETLDDYLIRGEHARLEFKSTLRWDIRNSQVNKELQKVIVKSIVGFLNSEGGILLIGVTDDNSVFGIEKDMETIGRHDRDGFEQTLFQLITTYLGPEFSMYIHVKYEEKEGQTVCIIEIESSSKPVFLNDRSEKEFYVRSGNTTKPLDIQSAHDYIGMHWNG